VGMRREKTGIEWKERKEGAKYAMRRERETIEHMWNRCSEMRERKRKERGEILREDGREIIWMKEIWNRRERIEKERRGEIGLFFGIVIFMFVITNPKSRG
jgi:hypothetical protein